MKRIILIISCLLAFSFARADGLRTPGIFSDNMVLQQNTDANIWGWADAGAKVKVKVSWSKKSYSVKAGDDGFWKVPAALCPPPPYFSISAPMFTLLVLLKMDLPTAKTTRLPLMRHIACMETFISG